VLSGRMSRGEKLLDTHVRVPGALLPADVNDLADVVSVVGTNGDYHLSAQIGNPGDIHNDFRSAWRGPRGHC